MRIVIIHIKIKMTETATEAGRPSPCSPETLVPVRQTGSLRQISSADLLGNSDALAIRHQGESYFLRKTRAGKLILTK